ncbi:MAG: peptidoglycan DD-metalloendopeptidase family protein [Saprospiraceae bacterium]|nr:peptidoglycan DD-metalloendopeptidase family protein [Saprospiraceae bacterium]
MRVLLFLLAMGGLFFINSFIISSLVINYSDDETKQHENCQSLSEISHFGFREGMFHVEQSKILSGQSLGSLFQSNNLQDATIKKAIQSIQENFSTTKFIAGNKIAFIHSDLCKRPDYFCYEINNTKYLVCQLFGDYCVELVEKEKSFQQEVAYGFIDRTLWHALGEENISLNLIDQMEDALASAVDFHHVQKGDIFKLVFNRLYIEGKPTDDGELLAAYFNASGKDNYSFKYKLDKNTGYYDLQGRPMKSRFLKAPLRFSRVTSGFNPRRLHPVLKYSRPHLGTDYAAPHGTPIMAVGSGVVEAASYTGGNGNYVKIKHDNSYQTQYLHMSRFASGIRRGTHVSQGQVIGYVGSTGLATGPHVCFRFWKNGRQVDHRRLSFPSPEPLPASVLPEFMKHKEGLLTILDQIDNQTALNKDRRS